MPDDMAFANLIPLFPLPNVVLFPKAVLPLQLFEPRYRSMAHDALNSQQLIAMALLKPGYETCYYTNEADIHAVVCVGRIQEHVQLADGRYLLNLVGVCPARVRYEDTAGTYRCAMLEPITRSSGGIDADGQYTARRALSELIHATVFAQYESQRRIARVIRSAASLDEVVDCTAAELLPDDAVDVKQYLLAETDTLQRASILRGELQMLRKLLESREKLQNQWPHFGSDN